MSDLKKMQNVVTGKVRLSYEHLFKPEARKAGDEPKYGVTLLIPKSDVATKQRIDNAINAAIQIGVTSKWDGVRPPIIGIPLYDGDGVRPSDGMPFGAECKGNWVMTASSKNRVEIVDENLNAILNPTEIYSGVYARVSIQLFPYQNSGKKGIGCGLGPVQKLGDGESLAGGISAAAAFGGSSDYASPQYAQQQPAYVQPQYPQQPYAQPATQYPPQQAVDPITGKPVSGGVMGI